MKTLKNIEAVILDKDGVFVNFHKMWLRIIAYRAQLIAENSSDTSDTLVQIRTACIRAMGVDEDDETIDPYGPCSMTLSDVRLALATALFITKNELDPTYKWFTAFNCVDDAIAKTWEALTVAELSEEVFGSIDKIQEIAKAGLKIGVFSSDSEKNVKETLSKFGLSKAIKKIKAGEHKTTESFIELCDSLGVNPENTIMVSDAPHDIAVTKAAGAHTIGVLSGIMSESEADQADIILDSLAALDVSKISSKKKVAK